MKFVLTYCDLYYEERCSDRLEQLLRRAEFKEFLFEQKAWLWEWFTLFSEFTAGDPTKTVSLKQLVEGCNAIDLFPGVLTQHQVEHVFKQSLSSCEELQFEDFVKAMLYIGGSSILLEQERAKQAAEIARLKKELERERDPKKRTECYTRLIA